MFYPALAMDRPVALESQQQWISSCKTSEPGEAHPEVFLSHAGKQKLFVQDLYDDFKKWPRCPRIDPFFDQSGTSLPKGEEFPDRIFEAARKCAVAVVILTKEYVTSKWPMLELLTFVEAQETSNPVLKLLPVFYDDLPTSVMDDSWIAAWENMKAEREDTSLGGPQRTTICVELCKKALHKLRKSNGLVAKNHKSYTSLREEIVREVVKFLPSHSQMETPQQVKAFGFERQGTPSVIVGVDEHFEKLKMSVLQSHGGEKASYFGLQGRGGAGKTLLAQMLNNDEDIQMKYGKGSIIWMTVGHDARICDLYEKMGRCCILDEGVLEMLKSIKNQEDQRTFLQNVYAKKKVFLILDDVWEKPKYDCRDMMYWLDVAQGSGSATLITSRSKSVLGKVRAKVEVVLLLPKEESWKLFRYYAFQSDRVLPTTLKQLAQDVCEECKGLPLALKVIGSAMADKESVEEWRCALHDLRQSKSILDSNVDDELFGRLELSYKELKDDATRICFLYFAVFPEDYKIPVQRLFSLWVGEELFGSDLSVEEAKDKARVHLEILVRRSLIDWSVHGYSVHVHDVLRDLALHIIGTAGRGECGHECFFQSKKKNATFPKMELLKDLKRISFVDCNISGWPPDLEVPHLKVCILQKVCDIQGKLSSKLLKSMVGLECLDLSDNHVRDAKLLDFEGLISLRYLTLGGNDFHELPMSIVHLKRLLYLDLNGCTSLKALSENIGKLNSLVELNLEECRSLGALPKSIGNLNSLVKWNLRGCRSVEVLPESIGNLNSLVELNFDECRLLKALPESIGNLNSLVELNLEECGCLKALPKSICNLNFLMKLKLRNCGSLKALPKSIGNLNSLVELDLGGCVSLEALPESIGNLISLVELNLRSYRSLEALPKSIGNLNSLVKLDLRFCGSLEAIPNSIGNLNSLVELNLGGCVFLKALPNSIGSLNSLVELNLEECRSLETLSRSIGNLDALVKLNLRDCGSLEALPESIGNLNSLVKLDLGFCGSLKALPKSIGNLNSLVELDLEFCKSLEALPESIGNLNSLVKLNLYGCRSLETLQESSGNLNSLMELNLGGCGSLEALPKSIGNFNSLVKLIIRDCRCMEAFPKSIGNLNSLVELDSEFCESLKALPESIGNLNSLVELNLYGCGSLEALPESIGNLNSLVKLNLGGCGYLEALPESIGNLNSLVELNLRDCGLLEALPESIGNLNSLVKLIIRDCRCMEAFPKSIGNLNSLVELDLEFCESLKALPESIGDLNSLVELNLYGCGSLEALPESIGNLNSLVKLNLGGCRSLGALPKSIGNLNSLVKLNWRG